MKSSASEPGLTSHEVKLEILSIPNSKSRPVFLSFTGAITDYFHYCQTSTEFLKKKKCNRMKGFIETQYLLSSSQYGFRRAHSTGQVILDVVESIRTNTDKKPFSGGVLIDLKKAFDTVDH